MSFWKKLFSFKGRISRKEFWLFHLIFPPVLFIVILLVGVLSGFNGYFIFVVVLLSVLSGISELSLVVRRLHDIGKSGWAIFTAFAPDEQTIPLRFFFKKGISGSNIYGSDPLLQNEGKVVGSSQEH